MQTVREIRFFKKISQWRLAKDSGVFQSKISLIENDLYVPKDEEIAKLSKALNVDPETVQWPESTC